MGKVEEQEPRARGEHFKKIRPRHTNPLGLNRELYSVSVYAPYLKSR